MWDPRRPSLGIDAHLQADAQRWAAVRRPETKQSNSSTLAATHDHGDGVPVSYSAKGAVKVTGEHQRLITDLPEVMAWLETPQAKLATCARTVGRRTAVAWPC